MRLLEYSNVVMFTDYCFATLLRAAHVNHIRSSYYELQVCMSFLLSDRNVCLPSVSHAALWWVTVSMPTGQTDGQTPNVQWFTL